MNETSQLWWHVYGAVESECESWMCVTVGESTKREVPDHIDVPNPLSDSNAPQRLNHLASFDHDPTHEEKLAITPEEYWDDDDE